jgi:hypothetical protein
MPVIAPPLASTATASRPRVGRPRQQAAVLNTSTVSARAPAATQAASTLELSLLIAA